MRTGAELRALGLDILAQQPVVVRPTGRREAELRWRGLFVPSPEQAADPSRVQSGLQVEARIQRLTGHSRNPLRLGVLVFSTFDVCGNISSITPVCNQVPIVDPYSLHIMEQFEGYSAGGIVTQSNPNKRMGELCIMLATGLEVDPLAMAA